MQLNQGIHINFVGRRLKTKDDVKLRLFEAEIPVKLLSLGVQSSICQHGN